MPIFADMTMKKLRTIEMNRLSVEEFKEAEKLPLIVVLDDVRSMHNVGSVFRTGDAFRIEAVYLCGITSTPPMTEIHKTALGAEDLCPLVSVPSRKTVGDVTPQEDSTDRR